MRIKTAPASIKATDEDSSTGQGEFEAIVSAFGNVDSVGDVVLPGAFEKSLDRWGSSGDPIPVIWSHDHNNPDAHIGAVKESKEVESGLWVKGTIDLDEQFSAKVYRLMKSRRVTKFSFAYDMKEYEENDQGGFNLKELDLFEVGPTLIPANAETELLAVKNLMSNEGLNVRDLAELLREIKSATAHGSKAGRVLSAKNEALLSEIVSEIKTSAGKLDGLLKAVRSSGENEDESKAREGQLTGDKEQPAGANAKKAEELQPATESQSAKSQPATADVMNELQLMMLEADTY